MSSLQMGRLIIGPPLQWHEAIGEPMTNLGGAPIPAPRQALRHMVSISSMAADGSTDTVSQRIILRDQLRSMMNNVPFKSQGFFYVQYSDDPTQNGWYMPDQGQIADYEAASGLATGLWKIEGLAWLVAGHKRTNREARNIILQDLRTGIYWRDTLKAIASTDFSALPAIALHRFPHGAVVPTLTAGGAVVATSSLPTGRDGGICKLAVGLSDLATASYERTDANMTLSDVIIYDRMGQQTGPATGPDTSWVEVYGPDWPWNWGKAGQQQDAPVLDNGLIRVRYAPVGNRGNTLPGFVVEAWSGTAYVEQGTMLIGRNGDLGLHADDTWVSASIVEYTPEVAIALVTFNYSSDASSYERVYITVRRGVMGADFEIYPSPLAAGTAADATLLWYSSALPSSDINISVYKSDTQTLPPTAGAAGIQIATAGGGSSILSTQTIGAANFTVSENFISILRCAPFSTVRAFQQTIAVRQGASAKAVIGTADSSAYGTNTNVFQISSQSGAGYIGARLRFSAAQADQILEAESMTLGTGTTAGGAVDASGGAYAQASRTTDANVHVSRTSWPNSFQAIFHVFARVKTTGTQMSIYAKTGATIGATRIVSGAATPTYTWVDLGEITANNTTLEIHAWVSTGSGIVEVDRIESYLVQDRTRTGAQYIGSRDIGQSALYESRQTGAVVAR